MLTIRLLGAAAGAALVLGLAASGHASLTHNALSINALSINALTFNALSTTSLSPALSDLNGVEVQGISLPEPRS